MCDGFVTEDKRVISELATCFNCSNEAAKPRRFGDFADGEVFLDVPVCDTCTERRRVNPAKESTAPCSVCGTRAFHLLRRAETMTTFCQRCLLLEGDGKNYDEVWKMLEPKMRKIGSRTEV